MGQSTASAGPPVDLLAALQESIARVKQPAPTCEPCGAGYRCRVCREVVCVPCDIGQPDCAHAGDLCAECRLACAECRDDARESA